MFSFKSSIASSSSSSKPSRGSTVLSSSSTITFSSNNINNNNGNSKSETQDLTSSSTRGKDEPLNVAMPQTESRRRGSSIFSSIKKRINSFTSLRKTPNDAVNNNNGNSSSRGDKRNSKSEGSDMIKYVKDSSMSADGSQNNFDDVKDPTDEEKVLIDRISIYFESKYTTQTKGTQIPKEYNAFIGKATPKVSVKRYVYRIVKYLNVWGSRKNINTAPNASNESDEIRKQMQFLSVGARAIIASTCVFDKMIEINKGKVPITPETIHRVILICTMISVKVNEDRTLKNITIANIGGIPVDEANDLELLICNLLNFELLVNADSYRRSFVTFNAPVTSSENNTLTTTPTASNTNISSTNPNVKMDKQVEANITVIANQ